MKQCKLRFTSQTTAYALNYSPEGKEAYDLAKGQNFDSVCRLFDDVIIYIPLTLAIKSEIFKNSFTGTVYVKENSLLWAVKWYIEDDVLKPLIDTRSIVDSWELAKFPKEWNGTKKQNHNQSLKIKLAKNIGILEQRINDYKNQLLDIVGCDNFDELERCTHKTCVFPKYYNKCKGKFINVCEAF